MDSFGKLSKLPSLPEIEKIPKVTLQGLSTLEQLYLHQEDKVTHCSPPLPYSAPPCLS